MNQAEQVNDAGSRLLKGVAAIVLVFAIIENGWLFLALTWNLGAMISPCIPAVLVLTDLLFLWLRFTFRDTGQALLGAAVAAATAPWTALFLIVKSTVHSPPWPRSVDAAYLVGSLIPYALLAAVGLWGGTDRREGEANAEPGGVGAGRDPRGGGGPRSGYPGAGRL